MKRCPTCEKTYDDNMRFCQADGTPLEQAAEPVDPYKTMVARPGDIAAAIPKSSFDAPAAPPKPDHEEVLQLPNDKDSRKTSYASEEEIRSEMASQPPDEQVIEIPPLSQAPVPEPPKFNEPSLSPPSFGDIGSKPPSPFDAPQDKPPSAPPDFQKTSPPIPSPFNEPKPVEKVAPASFEPQKPSAPPPSPFDTPKPAAPAPPPSSFKEPEPVFQQSVGGNPFDQPSAPPAGPADWNPPPVPDSGWENAPAAQDQGFNPPAAAKGPSQTLAIVSLVLGVLGIVLCSGLTGPIAFIMGIMARRKASRNPAQYGGAGLALGGIITGIIGTLELLLVVAWVAYVFLVVGSAAYSGY